VESEGGLLTRVGSLHVGGFIIPHILSVGFLFFLDISVTSPQLLTSPLPNTSLTHPLAHSHHHVTPHTITSSHITSHLITSRLVSSHYIASLCSHHNNITSQQHHNIITSQDSQHLISLHISHHIFPSEWEAGNLLAFCSTGEPSRILRYLSSPRVGLR